MRHDDGGESRELSFLLAGLLGVVAAGACFFAPWPPLPYLQPTPQGLRFVYAVSLVGGIVGCLGLDALISLWHGRPLGFLRKGLTTSVTRDLDAADVEAAIEQLQARATALGMTCRAEDPARTRWQLTRIKDALVQSFRQHAFTGSATLRGLSPETARLTLEMTFEDTLLVESGEEAELQNLCRHLAGLDELPLAKEVSLTLLVGWAHAMACAGGTLALATGLTREVGWLRGPAFVGLAVFAISAFVILRRRDRLTGWKLILQGTLMIGLSMAAFSRFATLG